MIRLTITSGPAGLRLSASAPDVAKRRAVAFAVQDFIPAGAFYAAGPSAWVVDPASADRVARVCSFLKQGYGDALEVSGLDVLSSAGGVNTFFEVLLDLKESDPRRYAREVPKGLDAQVRRYAAMKERRQGRAA